jgi:pyruvate formate lyase activating enzyme
MRSGTATTSDAVLADVARHARLIATAGGGFTVSGGEPLLQPAFTGALLTGARDLGLHTALDTSGFLGARATDDLLGACSHVLLDIKSWDRSLYRRLTGRELHPTLTFARRSIAPSGSSAKRACSPPDRRDRRPGPGGPSTLTRRMAADLRCP